MADLRKHSSTSNRFRFLLKHATTGQGLTGLDNSSSGLIIATICDNEATPTLYTVAAGNVETISTLGTFAAPTTNKCRFKAVDGTNHPGLYEFQFADARFSVANAQRLVISVSGATNLLNADYEVQLIAADVYDAVRLGLTALPNAVPAANGGLPTVDGNNRIAGIQGAVTNLNNLDATISSRSSHTAADVWSAVSRTLTAISDPAGVTTLLDRLTAQRGTNLDNLNATISSRLASAFYTAPPSSATIVAAILAEMLTGVDFPEGTVGEHLQRILPANSEANALLDLADGIETGETLRQNLRLIRAILIGLLNRTAGTSQTGTAEFLRKDGTTVAATTVYDDGERTGVTIGDLD